jgi:hypothetical protein
LYFISYRNGIRAKTVESATLGFKQLSVPAGIAISRFSLFREEQLKKEIEAGEKGAHVLTNRLAQTEARLLEAEVGAFVHFYIGSSS